MLNAKSVHVISGVTNFLAMLSIWKPSIEIEDTVSAVSHVQMLTAPSTLSSDESRTLPDVTACESVRLAVAH